MECADVTNASSCVAYNATNWPLPGYWSYTLVEDEDSDSGGEIAVEYTPASKTAARVEVSVFEWAGDGQRIGPF